MARLKAIISHPGVILICRLVLGFTFIYASLCKLYMPAQFAKAIHNYQMLPDQLVNLLAIFLPALELTAGVFVLVGFQTAGSIRLIVGMLLMFMGALAYNVVRGLNPDCGCFGSCPFGFLGDDTHGPGGLIGFIRNIFFSEGSQLRALIRDLVYLALAGPILFFEDKFGIDAWRKQQATSPAP